MRRVALKGLAFRKVRALLTALAVVLGVAMVSGTYVLTDSIQRAFDGIFTGSYEDTSAVISVPSMATVPLSGRSRPARMCISVDLPEPDGPITAVSRPFAMSTETPRSASTAVSPSP